MAKISMQDRLEKVFSPSVSLTEIDGLWYPTTANDAHALYCLIAGQSTHWQTEELDNLLEVLGANGYTLETIPEPETITEPIAISRVPALFILEPIGVNDAMDAVDVLRFCSDECLEIVRANTEHVTAVGEDYDYIPGYQCDECGKPLTETRTARYVSPDRTSASDYPYCVKCERMIRDREYQANADGTYQHLNACEVSR